MRPEDIYALTGVADPRISPDGRRVAYQVSSIDEEKNEYRGAIWVTALDGSGEPRKFSSGERRDGGARWSPDGRWLAFTSNRGDDKTPSQLYVIPAEGGEARRLTDAKEGVDEVVWSPDSTRLAYSMRVRDDAYEEEDEKKRKPRRLTRLLYKLDNVGWTTDRRKHLFVVELDGGEPRQLTDGDCEDSEPAWSPDGKRIAFTSLRGERWDTELIDRLYVVDANGGEPTQLAGDDGSYTAASFSPDGSRIAFRYQLEDGTFPHHGQVGVMDADGSNRQLLTTSLDRQANAYTDIREPIWDGDRLDLHRRGRRQHPSLRRRGGRLVAAGAPRRRRAVDRQLRRPRRRARLRLDDAHDDARALRRHRRAAPDRRRARVHRRTRPHRAGAVHGCLGGRRGGRRLARPPRRFRGGEALPDAALHPRRPVHAVRHGILRRVPGLLRRGLCRALLQPARRLRLLGGMGPRDSRADRRRRPGLGQRRLRRRDGGRRHGARDSATFSTRSGSA